MKLATLILASLLASACAREASTANANSTPAPAAVGAAAPATGAPAALAAPAQAGERGSATGTITAIDPGAGRITISHGPVGALGWPAMTMAFTGTPAQLAAARVGEKVDFEFVASGMDATLIHIAPTE